METGDYTLLIKDNNKVPEETLQSTWEAIYTQYCDLTNDNKSLYYYKLVNKVAWLKARIIVCNQLILQMASRSMNEKTVKEYAKGLLLWGIKYEKDIINVDELEKCVAQLKFTKNELELKQHELDGFNGDGDSTPLYKQVVMAEQALGKNLIDPEITSVEKWVYYMEAIKDINTQKKKQIANGGK